jgi:tRNA (adenine22-N1)-methyltransferase
VQKKSAAAMRVEVRSSGRDAHDRRPRGLERPSKTRGVKRVAIRNEHAFFQEKTVVRVRQVRGHSVHPRAIGLSRNPCNLHASRREVDAEEHAMTDEAAHRPHRDDEEVRRDDGTATEFSPEPAPAHGLVRQRHERLATRLLLVPAPMHLPVSARLDAILSLLLPCDELADVCSDHGVVSVVAVQRGLAKRAVCADLRSAPLAVARQNIARAALADRVTVLQGDGLAPLASCGVDAVVIAGVSGGLIVRLLDAQPDVVRRLSQLVLQPNQEPERVRAWALRAGFHMRAERMVEERGYFFPIGAYGHGEGRDPAYDQPGWSEQDLCMAGPMLLAQRDAVAARAYREQRERLGKLLAKGFTAQEPEHALWARACEALALTP